jgi:hypothetical protein
MSEGLNALDEVAGKIWQSLPPQRRRRPPPPPPRRRLLGPARYCSPRHRMRFDSRHENLAYFG